MTGRHILARIALAVGVLATPAGAAEPVAGGIPLEVKQAGQCSAFAPADWTFSSNPQSSTAEAVSPDRTMYAGWGVAAINRAQQLFYGDIYADPETSIRWVASQILAAVLGDTGGIQYTASPRPFLGQFSIRPFESAESTGLVFHRIYPGSTPQIYVESMYFAAAHKTRGEAGVRLAAGVTVSIRCLTRLVPGAPAAVRPRHGATRPRAACGSGGSLRGYQKELGTQYAYAPSTGQNFLVDPATQWNETGPQGAGYYRRAGNGYEKLELGRSDDC